MYRVIQNSKRQKAKSYFGPGTYPAVVQAVQEPEGFDSGEAIDFIYRVEVGDQIFSYSERFFIGDNNNPRTQELDDYLSQELELEHIEEIVGMRFLLRFAYQVKHGKRYLNIVEREAQEEVREHV